MSYLTQTVSGSSTIALLYQSWREKKILDHLFLRLPFCCGYCRHLVGIHVDLTLPNPYPSSYVLQRSSSKCHSSRRLLSFSAGASGFYVMIMPYSKELCLLWIESKVVFIHEFAMMLHRAKKKRIR